ncbi:MAG: hypothetical protein ACR2RA_10755 [Geminicoccaceae bacterium]
MFDSVNALARRLPQPVMTGDPRKDRQVRGQIMANARLLQSEAVSCVGRAVIASLRSGWHWMTRPIVTPPSHQA